MEQDRFNSANPRTRIAATSAALVLAIGGYTVLNSLGGDEQQSHEVIFEGEVGLGGTALNPIEPSPSPRPTPSKITAPEQYSEPEQATEDVPSRLIRQGSSPS